jgi:4-amino-4-deoxy-L-arabinose transferase-like glycosyltransferase
MKSLRTHIPFLLILLGAAILYTAILFTSQRAVDGDEAVVGIMARHIVTRGETPVFFYGQPYGGGGAIEAWLAALPMTIFGMSGPALKCVALAFSIAGLCAAYVFARRYLSLETALISALIIATATPLIEWHTKMRGGYAAVPLTIFLVLICFCRIVQDHKERGRDFLLFGLACGFAFYNKALVISILATLLFASAFYRQSFWRWRRMGYIFMGGLLGALPMVIHNLLYRFANLRYIFGPKDGAEPSIFERTLAMPTNYLPAFFTGRNVDQPLSPVPTLAWVEYLLYAALLISALVLFRKGLVATLRAWWQHPQKSRAQPRIECILIVSILVHLLACLLSKKASLSPRYLLPLFPPLCIVAASITARLWGRGKPIGRLAAYVIVALLCGMGLWNHIAYLRPCTVADDVVLPGGQLVTIQTPATLVPDILAILEQHAISHVRAPYFLQWRILFESRESVIASSVGMFPVMKRFPEYDQTVADAPRVALIAHKDSAQYTLYEKASAAKGYAVEMCGDYAIWIPKATPIR